MIGCATWAAFGLEPHIIAAMTGDAVLHRRRSRSPLEARSVARNHTRHSSADPLAIGTSALGHLHEIVRAESRHRSVLLAGSVSGVPRGSRRGSRCLRL